MGFLCFYFSGIVSCVINTQQLKLCINSSAISLQNIFANEFDFRFLDIILINFVLLRKIHKIKYQLFNAIDN